MIKIGNITSTHGIKGELKLYSDFSQKEKIMQKDFPIYIENTLHHITSVRPHKNYYLIRIDDIKVKIRVPLSSFGTRLKPVVMVKRALLQLIK